MSGKGEKFHVIPNLRGGWDIVKENTIRTRGHYTIKKEAIEDAKKMIDSNSILLIHDKNGKIQTHLKKLDSMHTRSGQKI